MRPQLDSAAQQFDVTKLSFARIEVMDILPRSVLCLSEYRIVGLAMAPEPYGCRTELASNPVSQPSNNVSRR